MEKRERNGLRLYRAERVFLDDPFAATAFETSTW